MLGTASICHVYTYCCNILLLPALVQVRMRACATFTACIAVQFLFSKPTDDIIVEAFNVATRTVANKQTNCVALVRERTIPTERPPPVGELSANFCGQRGVTWSAQRVPTAVNLCFLDLEPLLCYSSSSSIDLTRLSGPRSRRTTTQKIWQRRESNPGPLYLQPETLDHQTTEAV